MQTLINSTKHIGYLAIALTIALGANLAYGQWADPTQEPPGGNAAPLNDSGEYQIKNGDLGVLRMLTDQYCDAAGDHCFTPSPSGPVNAGEEVLEVAGRCYAPSDNVQIDGEQRNIIEEVPCDPVTCEVRFVSRVHNNNRDDIRTIEQTSASGLAGIYYWQHQDNNPPSAYGPTERLAHDAWGGAWNDKSERGRTYYLDDTDQTSMHAYLLGRVNNNTDYATFPLVPGATATLDGWGSPYHTFITAEVLNCTPL